MGSSAHDDLDRQHVLLGWRYLRWAFATGDLQVRSAVAAVFTRAGDYVGFGPVTERKGSVSAMKAHGYLPIDERRALALRALREVVAPAARALLGGAEGAANRARATRSQPPDSA